MLDFRSIETFLWVVKLGSFRGAAQRLNTTQPAISQRIAQLEREMGVKLLNRDHRMASPTPSGRQMMVYAEKLIGLRAAMVAEVGDRSAMRGVMRLGVAETIVHTWLPRLVKSMNEVYREPVARDRGRHHPEPHSTPARAGDRACICGRAAVGLRRT
ncbi:DNA-binding transcriptional LysR family regulator [Bradyrhizobium sp. LM2.7]